MKRVNTMRLAAVVTISVLGASACFGQSFTTGQIDEVMAAFQSYDYDKDPAAMHTIKEIVQYVHGRESLRKHTERKLIDLLESEASPRAKQFACQQLWVIGSEACVPVLAKMLREPATAEMACYALLTNPAPAADEALRGAAAEVQDGSARVAIIGTIGDRGDRGAVDVLEGLLDSQDAQVPAAAAEALGKVGGDKAAEALDRARDKAAGRMRADLTRTLLRCAESLAGSMPDKAAVLYAKVLQTETDILPRRAAMLGTMRLGTEVSTQTFLRALASEDAELKTAAIANSHVLQGPEMTRTLITQLKAADPDVQVLLIEALTGREADLVRPAIHAVAGSRQAPVRIAAFESLAQIGNADSARLLCSALGKANGDPERNAIGSTLRRMKGDEIDQALTDALGKASSAEKVELLGVLSDRGAEGAVPRALELTGAEAPGVREAAWKALARLAGPDTLGQMVRRFAAGGSQANPAGERAILAVADKRQDGGAEPVLAAYESATDPAAKQALLRILGGIGSRDALRTVKAAMDDPELKETAIRELSDWRDPLALPTLRKIVETSQDRTHRILALRGCIRLLGEDEDQSIRDYQMIAKAVTRPEEKRLILSGLATIDSVPALCVASAYLKDEQVSKEAALTVVTIAETVAASDPQMVADRLSDAEKIGVSEALASRIAGIHKRIDAFDDFILVWQFAGPYAEAGKNYSLLFDTPFAPETGDSVKWRILHGGTKAARPQAVDIASRFPVTEQVGYLRTWVHSNAKQDLVLHVGMDDGIKIWLNGKMAYANNTAGAAVMDAHKAPLTLDAGWNELLVKATQSTGPWEFYLRLRQPDGSPAQGLKYDAHHEPLASGIDFESIGPITLFDGKSLDGWKGRKDIWRIQDGVIVGGSLEKPLDRNEFLTTKRSFGDFELQLQVKLLGDPAHANAGIQIRSQRVPNHNEMVGYQADMGQHYWGCLYDESRRNRVLAAPDAGALNAVLKRDGWNDYRIRCIGPRIQLWINGWQTVDYTEPDAAIPLEGLIGLQIHGGPPAQARYRDITIRPVQR